MISHSILTFMNDFFILLDINLLNRRVAILCERLILQRLKGERNGANDT